jgi:hypothetical protein
MNSSVLTTAATAVVGLLLAVGTAFGLSAAAASSPEPVDEPTVLYGER